MFEIRLPYFSRCADDRRTCVEKRPRHIGSQATIGPGYQDNLAFHRLLQSGHQIPMAEKRYAAREHAPATKLSHETGIPPDDAFTSSGQRTQMDDARCVGTP